MANKRTLKKHIQQVCGQAAVEVLVNLPSDIAHNIVLELARLQSHSLANISFGFDHVRRDYSTIKEYNHAKSEYNRSAFNKLKTDFNENLAKIVKEINSSISEDERKANLQATEK